MREVKGNIRINSLYTFLSDLRTEGKITDCTPCNNPNRNAYFFELSIDNPISLFNNGFMATSRHLAIDEIYSVSPDKTGFRLAHYTEQYEKKEDGQIIVVHAYYDQQSNISDIQVKLNGIVLQNITQDMLSQIKANAVTATKKLLALIEQKDAKYLTLYQEAAALEKELEQMLEQKNWQSFKDIAKKYNDTINSMNKYCDDKKNVSHKIIEKLFITNSLQSAENLPNDEAVEPIVDEVELIDTTTAKHKNLSAQQQHQEALSEITKIQGNIAEKHNQLLQLQQIQMQELDAILERYKVTKEINELLMELWYLSDKHHISLKKANLSAISQQRGSNASSQMIDLKQLFKEKCLQLDLSAAEKIYKYIKDSMFDKEYLLDLLLNLCKLIPNLERELDMANILRFLFENNINIYRNILASKENPVTILSPVKRGVLASPIMLAFFYKKFELLEIFLKYSLNSAHRTGLVYSGKLIPLAKSIAVFGIILSPTEFTSVMQKLFKDNEQLIVDSYSHTELPTYSQIADGVKITNRTKKRKQGQNISNFNSLLSIKNYTQEEPEKIASALEKSLLTNDEYSILELSFHDYYSLEHLEPGNVTWLAEKSNLTSLLLALGKMLAKSDIALRLVPECCFGKALDIKICKNFQDVNGTEEMQAYAGFLKIFGKLSIDNLDQKISGVSLIFFIADNSKRIETAKDHFVNITHKLLEVLSSKLQQMSFQAIQEVVISMLNIDIKDGQCLIKTRSCMVLLVLYIRYTNQQEFKNKCFIYIANAIFKLAKYYFNSCLELSKSYLEMVIKMANYHPFIKEQFVYNAAVQSLQKASITGLSAQSTTQPNNNAADYNHPTNDYKPQKQKAKKNN